MSPYMSSLLLPESILKQLPAIAFHICGADPTRDGALLLEDKLRGLGVPTRLIVYKGLPHTFWNQPAFEKSAAYRDRLVEDAQWLEHRGQTS